MAKAQPPKQPPAKARSRERTGAAAPRPLYQQVKVRILDQIHRGQWRAGSKIPSENQLVQELGVSRMTVNRALRELAQEGYLQRVAGVGSFVAEPPRHASLIEIRDIAEEIRSQGSVHSADLFWSQAEPVDETVAERLGLEVGDEGFHVTIVHRRDELPIQLEDRWVNPAVVPDFIDIDFGAITPAKHLLRSVRPDEMEHIVQAVVPDGATSELLAIPATEPCLRLFRRTWNAGRVVTWAVLTYPASRYDLSARYALGDPGASAQLSLLPGGYTRKPVQ